MNTTTTAQPTPTSSDVDASIAATRRVQHLTAVVRDAIDDHGTLDGDVLAKVVVKALYDAHPLIRFEDALKLAVIVETPPPTRRRRKPSNMSSQTSVLISTSGIASSHL